MNATHRKRLVVLAVAGVLALVAVTSALAWSDLYVSGGVTFIPGDDAHPGFNSNLQGNAVDWDHPWGGTPNMGSRYINSSGDGLNSFDWHASSFIDPRTISYGAAQCRANTANSFNARVWQCYTNN
jgi:hypothetical protein